MKRTLFSSLLAGILLFGFAQQRSVTTATLFDWATAPSEEQVLETDAGSKVDEKEDPVGEPKKGNRFGRAISAPFRAMGRLFGGGREDNEQQAKRTSSKDASKFESAKVTRIKDARSESPSEGKQSASAQQSSDIVAIPADRLLQAGEFLKGGDLDRAIAELSTLASLNPQDAEVQNLLGVAFEGKGLRHRAIQSFEAAVRLDDKNAQYLNNYGFLLYKNGDFETATKRLRRAAKLSPHDSIIWNNLGLTLSQRGKFKEAYESFARAVGPFSGHVNVAAQLQRQGYAKEAIKHLETAKALRPDSIDVLSKLAFLYEVTGRISEADTARRSLVALQTSADANK